MMFGTFNSLAIVTCDGAGYIISRLRKNRANGGIQQAGSANTWYRIKTDANTYLSNIVAIRGSRFGMIAFTKDNGVEKLYTWGPYTFLGDNSFENTNRAFANEMELPPASIPSDPNFSNIKMIGATTHPSSISYYVLYTNGQLYALGNNMFRQLGDWEVGAGTQPNAKKWVQPQFGGKINTNNNRGPIEDIAWISPNEHDGHGNAAINVLTHGGKIINWGTNSKSMIGRGTTPPDNTPGYRPEHPNDSLSPPGFLNTSDVVSGIETGGHITLISKQCEEKFGYVGHAVHGSAGNNDAGSQYDDFTFLTQDIQVCGAPTAPSIDILGTPTIGVLDNICINTSVDLVGEPAGGVFSIVSGSQYGTLTNNVLAFNNTSGSITVKYEIATVCSQTMSTTKLFESENCTPYNISGIVWHDANANAIQELTEDGTNAEVLPGSPNPIWVNLINAGGEVVASKQVRPDGSFVFSTTILGVYEVRLSQVQIGIDVVANLLPASTYILPAIWSHTGTNVNNLPNSANLTGRIQNIDISQGVNSSGNNFGIKKDPIPTPIIIASFTASAQGSDIKLNWVTSTEIDNKGFEIEYTSDGTKWGKIAFVTSKAANGNHSGKLNYEFKHLEPSDSSNYYRLKQIDLEGKYSYSIVRSVYFKNTNSAIQLSPNPVINDLKIQGLSGKNKIAIYNTMGQKMMVKETNSVGNLTINMSGLNKGTYLVQITNEKGSITTHKIIKQ